MTPGAAHLPRRRLVLLAVVLVAAAALVLTDHHQTPDLVPAVTRAPAVTAQPLATTARRFNTHIEEAVAPATLDVLKPRVAAAGITDLFVARTWRKPAPVSIPVPVVPPTPEAPAVPYTFLGKQLQDGRWNVFLGLQSRTLIVKENDLIDGTWRVSSIQPPSMGLLHVPTGQQRMLPIGEGN